MSENTNDEKTWFGKGDKIIYQYTHHLNSRSTTKITKNGVFIRVVKLKRNSVYDWEPNRKVVVKLEGNKKESTVWESQIRHDKTQNMKSKTK